MWFTKLRKSPISPPSGLTHNVEGTQDALPGEEPEANEDLKNGKELPFLQHDVQDKILPCDSIANHSSRKHGSKSNVSTTIGMCQSRG